MFDQTVYHSRSPLHRSPLGAVPSGTAVTFTLRPRRADCFSAGTLAAHFEERGEVKTIPMPWTDTERGRDLFSCTLDTGDYLGLIWYSFLLTGPDGRREESGPYQLTVYDDAEQVPAWFGEGVSYQIFPDRFCRLSIPDPAGMVGGRTVHQSWDDEPEFRPDEKGEVRNRDFFGGSLRGVVSKLDYLKSLGVQTIYFNPIFEAAENHRYGTGDYGRIDPMLGCNEDFTLLCDEAHKRGMRVMLDGVFNHTGFVSKYFNGSGEYGPGGAAQDESSPYRRWFRFQEWPHQYDAWWGIYSLPAVEESDPTYLDFITGENGVVRRWLRAGADGWRLDVADELPDSFVYAIHEAARAEKPDAVVVGEVWEDGSNKIAYGKRRKHVLGGHCDGLMNYPLRTALLDWLTGGDAAQFRSAMETLQENYPPFAFRSAMNALGTHDTPRVLTLLGTGGEGAHLSKEEKSRAKLTDEQRALGLARLKLGFAALFAFPGSPTVYYGDEVGMEGWEDPFNRRTFPWGAERTDLSAHVAALGALRGSCPALRRGDLSYVAAEGGLLAFTRTCEEQTVLFAANNGPEEAALPLPAARLRPLLGQGEAVSGSDGSLTLFLPPMTAGLWELSAE